MHVPRCSLLVFCGSFALLACGCQEDEIRTYEVPKPAVASQAPVHQAARPVRLLAAIVPHGDRTWFFKLTGPIQEMETQKETFERFLQSVHFTDKEARPVSWTVPEGWRQEPGSKLRYATLRPEEKTRELELTVVVLGGEAGGMLANVNRWRGQIGLEALSQDELAKVTTESKIDGGPAVLVDMTGKSAPGGPKMPPFAAGRAPFAGGHPDVEPREPLTYTIPEDWKKLPASRGMRLAAFKVEQSGQEAEVTIIALGGPAGGLLPNVIRWRGQIGLEPIDEAQLTRELQHLEVDGKQVDYVDLIGPASTGAQRQRILAATIIHDDRSWFFKMMGPADLVGKQKPAFESFVRSVRWNSDRGANHE